MCNIRYTKGLIDLSPFLYILGEQKQEMNKYKMIISCVIVVL